MTNIPDYYPRQDSELKKLLSEITPEEQMNTNIKMIMKIAKSKHKFIPHFGSNDMYGYVALMEENGRGFGKMYWYHDETETVYLTDLNVSIDYRKQGLGRELQQVREYIAMTLGATNTRILALKDSWMQKWYERRGYTHFADHEDGLWIWMKKQLVIKPTCPYQVQEDDDE